MKHKVNLAEQIEVTKKKHLLHTLKNCNYLKLFLYKKIT